MKVLLLAPTPPPYGGIAVWTERMKKIKMKNGWSIDVVDEKVVGNRTAFKFRLSNIPNEIKRHNKIWKELKRKTNDKDVAIVQACIPAGYKSMIREIISAKIAKKRGKKFIVHFRCTLPYMITNKITEFIFKKLIKYADYSFVLNEKSGDFIKKYTKNYEVIPNFINTDEMYEKQHYSNNIKTALYVGGVLESKGCDTIIDIAKYFPEIQFRLIGKIGIETGIIPPNVILLGEKDQNYIKNEYKNADLFIFLTHFQGEGFSNALAEAMSHSIPCLVSDWAANKDMIENKGGIVVDFNDIDGAINAIKKLSDKKIRETMGKWNYKKVKNEYSEYKITSEYIKKYEQVAGII